MSLDSFFGSEDDGDEDYEAGTYEIDEDEPKTESLKQSPGPSSEILKRILSYSIPTVSTVSFKAAINVVTEEHTEMSRDV
jgi:hypothetical protein